MVDTRNGTFYTSRLVGAQRAASCPGARGVFTGHLTQVRTPQAAAGESVGPEHLSLAESGLLLPNRRQALLVLGRTEHDLGRGSQGQVPVLRLESNQKRPLLPMCLQMHSTNRARPP